MGLNGAKYDPDDDDDDCSIITVDSLTPFEKEIILSEFCEIIYHKKASKTPKKPKLERQSQPIMQQTPTKIESKSNQLINNKIAEAAQFSPPLPKLLPKPPVLVKPLVIQNNFTAKLDIDSHTDDYIIYEDDDEA